MKKRAIIVSFTLAFIVGVGAYAFYSLTRGALQPIPQGSEFRVPEPILQAPPGRQQGDTSEIPLPPPPTSTNNMRTATPEPSRRLVGITQERLRQIEEFLPAGSHIYLSPIGSDKSVAALVNADLYGDGIIETIVVHTSKAPTAQESTSPLVLSVLAPSRGALSVRVSVPLTGGVLFNIEMNGSDVPLAVADITGDGRPEIIVASGIGASLGAELQVFRVESSSLVNVSEIGGHVFRVRSKAGQPGTITVQSRYENKPTSFRWNGQQFVRIN